MTNKWIFHIIAFLLIMTGSCLEIEEASEIPEIGYERHIVYENKDKLGNAQYELHLVFEFVDGDGDIGNIPGDTIEDNRNFYYSLFVKEDGEFIDYEIEDTINYIIPYIEPQKSVRVVKGEIEVIFELKKVTFTYDTLMFDVYIRDRAGNESNTESTPEIILSEEVNI